MPTHMLSVHFSGTSDLLAYPRSEQRLQCSKCPHLGLLIIGILVYAPGALEERM